MKLLLKLLLILLIGYIVGINIKTFEKTAPSENKESALPVSPYAEDENGNLILQPHREVRQTKQGYTVRP